MLEMNSKNTDIVRDKNHLGEYSKTFNPVVVRASAVGFGKYDDFLRAFKDSTRTPWYGRLHNPTVRSLEEKIAALEGSEDAIAFSSGMGAISTTFLSFLEKGDRIAMVDSVFAPVRDFSLRVLSKFGIKTDFFSSSNPSAIEKSLRNDTRMIYLETPGCTTMDIQDLSKVSKIAKSRELLTVVDSTWATPLLQQPIKLGIDVVIHSGTKYLSGHSDVLAGFVASSDYLCQKIKANLGLFGSCLSPDDAYLVFRGIRTLKLRMKQHQESAMKVALWLESQSEVIEVIHPGLNRHQDFNLAKQQMDGYSGLFTFRLTNPSEEKCAAFLDSLRVFSIGVSGGGFESLINPLGVYFRDDLKWRERRGFDFGLYRLSIGLEDSQDLIDDLSRGLDVWEAMP